MKNTCPTYNWSYICDYQKEVQTVSRLNTIGDDHITFLVISLPDSGHTTIQYARIDEYNEVQAKSKIMFTVSPWTRGLRYDLSLGPFCRRLSRRCSGRGLAVEFPAKNVSGLWSRMFTIMPEIELSNDAYLCSAAGTAHRLHAHELTRAVEYSTRVEARYQRRRHSTVHVSRASRSYWILGCTLKYSLN
ncbi:hypothetical protein ES702_03714 [subsurface metagenome]